MARKRRTLTGRRVRKMRYEATLNWWNNPKSTHYRSRGYRYGARLR